MWRNVEARLVTLNDIFIVQFGSGSSVRRFIEFAVKDILGQATISHTMDMAHLAQTSLPHDGDEVIRATCTMVELET